MHLSKYETLEIEYNIFCRLFEHWQDFEKQSLPIVLEQIMNEILEEQEQATVEN